MTVPTKTPNQIWVYVAGMCIGDEQKQFGFTIEPDLEKYSDYQELYILKSKFDEMEKQCVRAQDGWSRAIDKQGELCDKLEAMTLARMANPDA